MANITYRCPECGGEIGWNGPLGMFKCEYCDGQFSKDKISGINTDTEHEDIQHGEEVDDEYAVTDDGTISTGANSLVKYRCSNCQAELITDKSTAASICVYCGRPIVMTEQIIGDFKPKYVLPFKKTKEEALTVFSKFMKKPLTPKDFKDAVTVDKVQGIYIPFWLFSGKCMLQGRYKSMNCVREKKTRVNDDERVLRIWDVYDSKREGIISFDKIPADGSSKTDDEAMQSIEPYDFKELIPFDPAYLSGYLAERYDEDASVQEGKIEDRIRCSAHDKLIETVDFDRVETVSFDYKVTDKETEYALLPTWLLYCTYKGKNYLFAMNGQTGKFIGNLPISIAKTIGIFIGTFLVSALFFWFL